MPTLYTHYKFGLDVLNNLDKDISKKINSNISYYNMFNQGWDNLYYYFKKLNYYKKLGVKSHKNNIDVFFINLFNYIKENKLTNDYNIVYGFINHYILDTLLHPLINYNVKYLNIPHTKIEYMIDSYLFKKNNNIKWNGKIYKTLIPKLKFDYNLKQMLNKTFKITYNEDNIANIFYHSHNNAYYLYRYFICDIHCIKKSLYKFIDLFNRSNFKFSKHTFNFKDFDKRILNLENNSWHHPQNKQEKYSYSFLDLYNISLSIAVKLNTLAYNILNNNGNKDEFIVLLNSISLQNISELPL